MSIYPKESDEPNRNGDEASEMEIHKSRLNLPPPWKEDSETKGDSSRNIGYRYTEGQRFSVSIWFFCNISIHCRNIFFWNCQDVRTDRTFPFML